MIGGALGELIIRIGADASDLNRTLNTSAGRVDAYASRIASAGARIAAVGSVIAGAMLAAAIKVDDALDTIRIGTGQTGAALQGLQADFQAVASSVPSSLDDTATAITDLSRRTGQTGAGLQGLATQILNLSRITGTDLNANIRNSTRVFGDWRLSTDRQAAALDFMFRAAQATGVEVDALGGKVVQFGAPLRQLGFSFEEAATLIASFEREGVNVDTVLSGLRKGLAEIAKAGQSAPETFRAVIAEIQRLGPGAKSASLAMQVFGTRAGPDMAAAILEGRLEIGALLAQLQSSGETINGASADTADFGEELAIMRNKAALAFGALSQAALPAFTALALSAANAVQGLADVLQDMSPRARNAVVYAVLLTTALGAALTAVALLTRAIVAMNATLHLTAALAATRAFVAMVPAIYATSGALGVLRAAWLGLAAAMGPIGWVALAATALLALAVVFRRQLAPVFGVVGNLFAELGRVAASVGGALGAVASGIGAAFGPALRVIVDFGEKVAAVLAFLVFGAIAGYVNAWRVLVDEVAPKVRALLDLISRAMTAIGDVISAVVRNTLGFFRAWGDGIYTVVKWAWDGIVGIVRQNAFLNAIVSAIGAALDWIGRTVSRFVAAGRELVTGLVRGILDKIRSIPGLGPGVADFIEKAFGGAPRLAEQAGTQAARAFSAAATAGTTTAPRPTGGSVDLSAFTGGADAASKGKTAIEQFSERVNGLVTVMELQRESGESTASTMRALNDAYADASAQAARFGDAATLSPEALQSYVALLEIMRRVRDAGGARRAEPLATAPALIATGGIDRSAARMGSAAGLAFRAMMPSAGDAFLERARELRNIAADAGNALARNLSSAFESMLPRVAQNFVGVFRDVQGARAAGSAAGLAALPPTPAAAAFVAAMEIAGPALEALAPAFAALVQPLTIIGTILGKALIPVFELLFPVVKYLAILFTYAAQVIANVNGAIFKAVGEVLAFIGSALAKYGRILGLASEGQALERFGRGMVTMSETMFGVADSMVTARRAIEDLEWDEALANATDAANNFAEALVNAVDGFKVAQYRFAATAVAPASATLPPATNPNPPASGGNGGQPQRPVAVTIPISFHGVPGESDDAMYRRLYNTMERKALADPYAAEGFRSTFPRP
jgi:phage-related minor tail protein